jgi:hypothetical protein
MHDAFEQFGASLQDADDNKVLLAKVGKLTIPVLAIGAEKSFQNHHTLSLREDIKSGLLASR